MGDEFLRLFIKFIAFFAKVNMELLPNLSELLVNGCTRICKKKGEKLNFCINVSDCEVVDSEDEVSVEIVDYV